jgi:FeS assembly protein IscX
MASLTWHDFEEIGVRLAEAYPDRDPLAVRFTELRQLVESLPDFEAEEGHSCNEAILEAIQAAWYEETKGGGGEDDKPGYRPPTPRRPE